MITVIGAKPEERKRIAKQIIKDAIAASDYISPEIESYYNLMSDSLRRIFLKEPKTVGEWKDIKSKAIDIITHDDYRQSDVMIAKLFLSTLKNGYSVSSFFRQRRGEAAAVGVRGNVYPFVFNSNESEELV